MSPGSRWLPCRATEALIGPLAACSPTRPSCITDKSFQPLSLLIGQHCRGHPSSGERDPHSSGGALTLSSDNDRGLFPVGCEARERRPEHLVRGTHHPPPGKGVRHTDGEESDRPFRLAGIGDRVLCTVLVLQLPARLTWTAPRTGAKFIPKTARGSGDRCLPVLRSAQEAGERKTNR
jgi:hypothetical protein